MKPVGCCSGEPLSQAYGLPAQHKARPSGTLKESLIHKLANAVSNKVDRLHQKTPEYQHYQYRQGQQPALASHRRTARNERIPPDSFDTAALEVTLPCLFQGRLCTNRYDSRGMMWASPPTYLKKFHLPAAFTKSKKQGNCDVFSENRLLTIAVGFRSVAFLHTPVLRLPVMHIHML